MLTIDDYERLPAEQARNHELVGGELVPEPGNTLQHNETKTSLIALLRPIVLERRAGTIISSQAFDFKGDALGPDISFFRPDKRPLVDRGKRVQRFVPDLAIEIVSADDMWASIFGRKERYRSCGTEDVWLISPDSREVLVFSARGDRILREDAVLSTELIPGFQIPVKLLFEADSD